jgi:hypothetical protein
LKKLATSLNVDPKLIPRNILYRYPTLSKVTTSLLDILHGGPIRENEADADIITRLINKYTTPKATRSILLTGSAGSLGIHILNQLLDRDDVKKVFCFTRASSQPASKHAEALRMHGMDPLRLLDALYSKRVQFLSVDLSKATFGLEEAVLSEVSKNVHGVVP